MNKIIIKNNEVKNIDLYKALSYDKHNLNIATNTILSESLIIKLEDETNEDLVINIGENSELKIITEVSSEKTTTNNYNININVGPNSNIYFSTITNLLSNDATLNLTFNLAKDSNLNILGGYVSNIIDSKIHIKLNGPNSNVDVKIIAISSNTNHQKIDVLAEHFAKHSHSNMTNIGIVSEKGKIILNGIAKIHQGSNGVEAFQSLKGITTSDLAKLEVNPILLIDEHDIKAGHGATVGKIEPEVLFYLMSRGLSRDEAKNIVIMGMLNPLITEITDDELKNRFIKMVNSRL